MNIVKCVIECCNEVFHTEEPVSPSVRFICKNHPRSAQVKAVGRVFDPIKDTKDSDIHFQDQQFESSDRSAESLIDEKNLLDGSVDPTKRHISWTAKRGN